MNALQLLQNYQARLKRDDGSAESFASLFKDGVELLDLDDEAVANRFSASRPTARRWSRSTSAPVRALRRQIVVDLGRDVEERIRRFERRAEST